ncbi:transposase [Enterococcus faecalis]|uniref:transposase n=1 Tax=Enterococcus faecalis TaxID=1351 RepID=UPI0034E5ABCE
MTNQRSRTSRNTKQKIKQALCFSYFNGHIECLNNHIKVLKRIAYCYKNFQNYRERIFLYRGKNFKKTRTPYK